MSGLSIQTKSCNSYGADARRRLRGTGCGRDAGGDRAMRWIRYEKNGHPTYGIVEGDMVSEVRGDPFAGYERTAVRQPMASVKLLTPVEPRTFYCAGLNYAEHVIEAARKRGQEPNLPQAADIGYRANNALIAHGEAIVISAGVRAECDAVCTAFSNATPPRIRTALTISRPQNCERNAPESVG